MFDEDQVTGQHRQIETINRAVQGQSEQNSGFLADSFAGGSLQQPFVPPGPDVGAPQAALVLCLYLAALLLIAALAFRQRDVT